MDYGLNAVTRVLIRESHEGQSQRRRGDSRSRGWSDGGPRDKECGQPLEAREGEEMDSPLELPEGRQPC